MSLTALEERRLAELKQYVTDRPAAKPVAGRRSLRRYARPVIALGAAAAAATAALVAASVGTGTPAYAVTRSADGTVTITLTDFRDTTQLSQELKQLGVPAAVYYIPPGQACYQADAHPVLDAPEGLYAVPSALPSGPGWSMRLDTSLLQPGQMLLFGISAVSVRSTMAYGSSTYLITGQATACQFQPEPPPPNAHRGGMVAEAGSFRFPGQVTPRWPSGMYTSGNRSPRS
jgi:hypothetical protein